MRLSVCSVSTPDWTPVEAVRILAAQGWDGIEWRIADDAGDPAEAGFWSGNRATWPLTGLEDSLDDIRRITIDGGLAFSGLGGYPAVGDRPAVERMLRACATLGAERARVTMPRLPEVDDYDAAFGATRDDIAWTAEVAASLGVQALVELHHGTIIASASSAARLLAGVDPAAVGVIHDLGNLLIEGHEDWRAAFQLLGDHLAHVHLKNIRWVRDPQPGPGGAIRWRDEWAPFWDGVAYVPDYLAALVEAGYDGWIAAEDFCTDLPLEERSASSLAFLREGLAAAGA